MQRLRHARDLEHTVMEAVIGAARRLVVAGGERALEGVGQIAQLGDVGGRGLLDRTAHELRFQHDAQVQCLGRSIKVKRRHGGAAE